MQTDLRVFCDIAELLTLSSASANKGRRVKESDLSLIPNAVMVCVDGKITWVGTKADFKSEILKPWGSEKNADFVSLQHSTVMPGFVECHTHPVFSGSRAHEFEWRLQGESYQSISAKGGGILSTVKATRECEFEILKASTQNRVDHFVRQGVTTLEAKSGYGLDLETELKSLRVLTEMTGPKMWRTYLGAHSRSPDFPDLAAYVEFIIESVLPRIAKEKLADRVDIYIEKGFYDLNLAEKYFKAARELGLPICAHVEQLSDFGGTRLALTHGAHSVDHVVFINQNDLAQIANSESTAVLLPTSDFYLKMRYPPARELIDAGACVALATDYNPGTSPTQELSFVGILARLEMKMTLAEIIAAYTVGAARALALDHEVGSLDLGKSCDFIVLQDSWRELFYSVGDSQIARVFRAGNELRLKQ